MNSAKIIGLSLIGICFLGPLTSSVEGVVGWTATIANLVAAADVIVTGTVSSIETTYVPGQSGSGRLVVSVNEVFKGNYANGLLYLSYGPVMSFGDEQSMTGERVLAFAKLNADGQSYTLVPTNGGPGAMLRRQVVDASSVADVPSLAITAQDTPLQKVIKEIGLIQIASPTSEGSPYLSSLPYTRVEPVLTEAVFRAILSSGPQGARVGAAGLVQMGGLSGLAAADALDIQSHPELSPIVSDIEGNFKDTSAAGLQILTRWLGSSMPAVKREAAAGALGWLHTPGAIMQLGPALNDSDFDVRWRAIGGLSMFANNATTGGVNPAAGAWPFRTDDTIKYSVFDRNLVQKNEAFYLNFWRDWWTQHQAQIQNLAAQAQ